MPIYEYACGACGHRFENMQGVNDPPPAKCPACSKRRVKRLVSAPAFRLKGSGWYESDFKTGKKRNMHDGSEAGGSGASSATDTASTSSSSPTDAKAADAKPAGGGEKPAKAAASEKTPRKARAAGQSD